MFFKRVFCCFRKKKVDIECDIDWDEKLVYEQIDPNIYRI